MTEKLFEENNQLSAAEKFANLWNTIKYLKILVLVR